MAENIHYNPFSSSAGILTQEEGKEVAKKTSSLTIGIPRELSANENRIGLVPSGVRLLVNHGHRILLEKNAGEKSRFSDHEYAEAGAEIIDDHASVFGADIVLKIAPPLREEIDLLEKHRCLLSAVQFPTRTKDYFQHLMTKKVNAIAFEFIQDKTGALPLVRSMSEIIGNATMLIAAEYLCHPQYGKGIMLGGFPGVPSTEVVVIGAGTVAEYASRAALGLGAQVKVFDNSIYKLRTLQNNLKERIYTSVFQPDEIEKALLTADVVIAAKHAAEGTTPCFIPAEFVKKMKPGSVIIDVSIDQGGCFETSRPTNHQTHVYQLHDITHYCVPNIASKVPRTASTSFSNFFSGLLLEIAENGGVDKTLKNNRAFSKGAYIFNGILTNHQISKLHDIPFQHLDLLLAAFY